MDSRARTFGRWLLVCSALSVPVFVGLALPGCAQPCLDDGLGQTYCPPASETVAATGDETGPGDGDPTGAEAGETEGCPLLDVILIPQTPTLVFLVDQSGSMNEDFGGDTRWNVITDVLINPQSGIVAQYEDGIRLGMTLYTSVDGNTMGGECPILIEVDPATSNFAAIESTMSMAQPVQDTPTGESLDLVWQKLDALDVPGNKYIVLATDGEPDTCAEPNPSNGQAEAIAAAEGAFGAGIETFIISVGSDVSAAHLQDMANAGQGVQPGDPDAPYYQALDQAALGQAFDQILASVRSCQLDLMSPLSDADAANCILEVNGDPVGLDDPNGWQLNDPTELELVGAACDALQQGTSSVQMTCACDAG
jgi:hypothetical protein